jgi:hypothetical protein
MRALVLIVAAASLVGVVGCSDPEGCPAYVYNDTPCSQNGMVCGGCSCDGTNWSCPDAFPLVHDLAVPDLSVRDLSPPGD